MSNANEPTPKEAAQLAAVFQKAYAAAVSLQRMDEQIALMLDRRQRLENEFRDLQVQLNGECDKVVKAATMTPLKLMAQIGEAHSLEATVNAIAAAGNGQAAPRVKVTKPLVAETA